MNIGNKERPVKMGLNQSILYCELRGINITQMNTEFTSFANGKHTGAEIRDLIWSALKDGARKEGTEFNYTNLDVGDWIEDLEPNSITEFIKGMAETMPKAKAKPVNKKKAPQKRSLK